MKVLRLSVWVAICWCAASASALAQATSADVYERLLVLAAEVDLLRLEMGVDIIDRPDIAVSGAQPREVYFQALTLFEKSDRLLFEQLRERADRPTEPTLADAAPADVLALVESSVDLITRVKQSIGITEEVNVDPSPADRTPTDVFKMIVRVNRTLNTLLKQRFAPADVYQQLTYGVGLTAGVLVAASAGEHLGTESQLARRKTPLDVYQKLIGIYAIIHETMALSGQKCLEIKSAESERRWVSPSDVYDMASLIVSELSYLHSISPNSTAPRQSFYPGDKFPSHAYQRAGRLENQLQTLRRHASEHPDWLKAR